MFSLMCGLKLWFVNRASDKMAAKKTKNPNSKFILTPVTTYILKKLSHQIPTQSILVSKTKKYRYILKNGNQRRLKSERWLNYVGNFYCVGVNTWANCCCWSIANSLTPWGRFDGSKLGRFCGKFCINPAGKPGRFKFGMGSWDGSDDFISSTFSSFSSSFSLPLSLRDLCSFELFDGEGDPWRLVPKI